MHAGFIFLPQVSDLFKKEYIDSQLLYNDFIKSKDIGLEACVTEKNEKLYGRDVLSDYYNIVDNKKYFLAKIKYGF